MSQLISFAESTGPPLAPLALVTRPIKSILVPIDFSEGSRLALSYAAFLAKRFEARIDLLHVWAPPSFVGADALVQAQGQGLSVGDYGLQRADRAMGEFLCSVDLPSNVESWVKPGRAASVIVETAADAGHDLIVMGTHGRTGLKHVVLGSVAAKVVRHAGCPVVTVPPGAAAEARAP